jgi:hypothetical protein
MLRLIPRAPAAKAASSTVLSFRIIAMQVIQLLYSKKKEIDLGLVLACWVELTKLWRPSLADSLGTPMPVYASEVTLRKRLAHKAEYAYSFDILLRICSPNRDTKQAAHAIFNEPNAVWVQKKPFANGLELKDRTLKTVECAHLTKEAIAYWQDLSPKLQAEATRAAQALIEADVESDDTIVTLMPIEVAGPSVTSAAASGSEAASKVRTDKPERDSILKQLVEEMHRAAFEPKYRKRSLGLPTVEGWDNRLKAYFWPNPACNYPFTCVSLQGLTDESQKLANTLENNGKWTADEGRAAVVLANNIFVWGGVPQKPKTVTAKTVEQVFRDAFDANSESTALMNSGWTKVAAFATAHLETPGSFRTQVIWDSRVATAIIGRLDSILNKWQNQNPRSLFPGIGTVPGQGGTRPREFLHKWPVGYRQWSAQISGSKIVRQLRDILNDASNDYPRMPMPDGSVASWTTRGVEMVLFMDGY